MSPDAQRIAIAEACGYTRTVCSSGEIEWLGPKPKREYLGRFDPEITPSRIPDYLHDLNAMHEAEKVLTYNSLFTYGEELCWVCAASQHDRVSLVPEVFSATAAQRAEAFLRTIGKWEDGK